MADYIASVISAAVLSGAAALFSPESWKKYVGMLTGLVVICAILAPLTEISVSDIFSSFNVNVSEEYSADGEKLRTDMICAELAGKVNEDIERRMAEEFGVEVRAYAEVGCDGDGNIAGVKRVRLAGKGITEKAVNRICEVYGVEEISVE